MWELDDLVKTSSICQVKKDGKWVPARPVNYKYRTLKQRLFESFQVFIGRADCFKWPHGQ